MQHYHDPFFHQEQDPPLPTPKRAWWRRLTLVQKIVGGVLLLGVVLIGYTLINRLSVSFLVEVPAVGGSFTEGVIGTARFVNPTLAISNADRDLTELVFAGLLKAGSEGLEPELAESYSISNDGQTYRFILKDNITFHDGTPVTADDVIFTIETVQNPALKSPHFANWEGIGVNKISEREVAFTLPEPYAPFLENTTLGILPKHLWEFATVEEASFSTLNTNAVGAGPFKIERIKSNDAGIPFEYTLTRFSEYALGAPHIKNVVIRFYRNEEALLEAYQSGEVDSVAGLTPQSLATLVSYRPTILTSPLPRIFAVFYNKNRSQIFTHHEVRAALDLAANKEAIVDQVLGGFGDVIDSPVPTDVLAKLELEATTDPLPEADQVSQAASLLRADGWVKNPEDGIWERETDDSYERLSFGLATADTPELQKAAEMLASQWRSFGAEVNLTVYDAATLKNDIIRPRRYDALFFGEIVGRELDLYAFWHASQRDDPGLNIALYTNVTANKALERARAEADEESRLEHYATFVTEVRDDNPATFLYSPQLIYITSPTINNISVDTAANPSERFMNVHRWYIETNRVWNL